MPAPDHDPAALPAFPPGFQFGTATAAYQIEGATTEDGRGTSIWDTFSHTPGKTHDGDTGDVACDHYRRMPEDVALMASLGADAYRFSVAWPRILPAGAGAVEPRGLDFYDRLVDALLAAGIAPTATLYHWDLPQPLEDAGGWLERDTAFRFAEYAGVAAQRLGDRVGTWITLNEPVVTTLLGYAMGVMAPGRTVLFGWFPVAHHQMLGHGLAVRAIRAAVPEARVGVTHNLSPVVAASDDPADAAAAAAFDAVQNRTYVEPVLGLGYPDFAALGVPVDLSSLQDGDLATIAAPLDVLGVNYYYPTRIARPSEGNPLPFELTPLDGYETTATGWPVVPSGLTDLLVGLRDRYPGLPPILVTENGVAFDDQLVRDGDGSARVDDPRRIAYLDGHLRAVHRAITSGVDVRGYYVWSLLDNFEWAEGYSKRFGLAYTEYATQERIPKASFAWYRDMIAAQRAAWAGAPGA